MRKYLRKNRKIRTAVSLAIMALMSVAIFLLFFNIELYMGYFSSHLFLESLRISGYASEMEQDMIGKQKELFASYGLPESLTEEIWGESKAYLAFSQYAESGEIKKEAADFGQQEVLEDYLQGQEAYETEGVKQAMENVVAESKAICQRYIFPSFVEGYHKFVQERRPVFIGLAAVSALIVALGALILFRSYHCRHHALFYITGSCFTALAWNVAATAAIRLGAWQTGAKQAYYLEFLDTFKSRGMYPWYIISIVAAAAAVLLLLVGIRMRNRKS